MYFEISRIVKEASIGLSLVHWQACLDGQDVEFVLGTSAERPTFPPAFFDIDEPSEPYGVVDIDFK